VNDSCLNQPGYAEKGDEQVDKWIPGRDIRSPEIRIEGFR
jgi:hypothetical protein